MHYDGYELFPQLGRVRLDQLCAADRFYRLDQGDAYAQGTQYDSRRYDWDGRMRGYGNAADIAPGWYVPLKLRRPAARYDLAKLIVRRLTAMVLGQERWPELRIDNDDDAEDYAKALVQESSLASKLIEARDKGGASGTACVSFSFVKGRPRVTVHQAKHIHVLRWVDRDDHRVGAVLKCYRYERTVWDSTGKAKKKGFFYARYWDETQEILWDPIPEAVAKNGSWSTSVKSYAVAHLYGETPFYWTQNLPDSEHDDGMSDFEGLEDIMDQINELVSATAKGTIANVDPTVVINDDPGNNPGVVKKGSGQAIFSPGGASYLELKGDAVKTALALTDALVQQCLDTAGVVVGDPDKIGSKAQSAAALKMLYLPMLNQCDLLRTQYGERLLRPLLLGMLRAARMIQSGEPGEPVRTADGRLIQEKSTVVLPPRVEMDLSGEEPRMVVTERNPGVSEYLRLQWPAYFKATATDIKQDVEAANAAKTQLISQRTATKHVAHHFGVKDVNDEVSNIESEKEAAFERMEGLGVPGAFAGSADDQDDDQGDDE